MPERASLLESSVLLGHPLGKYVLWRHVSIMLGSSEVTFEINVQ